MNADVFDVEMASFIFRMLGRVAMFRQQGMKHDAWPQKQRPEGILDSILSVCFTLFLSAK